MWSGSTTCCAMTSARALRIAQLASWDSRMMVEKPVRKSEVCISCTMPSRAARMTWTVMGSAVMSGAYPSCIRSRRTVSVRASSTTKAPPLSCTATP